MPKFRYSIECTGEVVGKGSMEAESAAEVLVWILKVMAVNAFATGKRIPQESVTAISVERE